MSKFLPVPNSTRSFWLTAEDEFATHRSTASLPEEADIVIVGSGYAGSTLAYYLMNDEKFNGSILMLEARNVCTGATGRNGGHLKPALYYNHNAHSAAYGDEQAAQIANFEYEHLAAMKHLIEKEKIDCDFVLTRSCDIHFSEVVSTKAIDGYNAMKENPFIKQAVKDDVMAHFGKEARVVSNTSTDVAFTYTAGQLWPYKLITGLLKKLVAKGLNLQTNTPVFSTKKLKDGRYLVKTNRGEVIAKKMVLCTNAYTASVEPRFVNKIVPVKGICSRIVSADAADPGGYLVHTFGIRNQSVADGDYLINRPDGSIILGGAKKYIFPHKDLFYNVVDDSTLIPKTADYFKGYMAKTFLPWKHIKEKVDCVWSGILGYTDDAMPYVGELEENKYIIAGFHGHGMPRVLLCSKALAKMIQGHSTELDIPEPFKASQKRLNSGKNQILSTLGTPASKL